MDKGTAKMALGEDIRRYGFWALDRMNNGGVTYHYSDIKKRLITSGGGHPDSRFIRLFDHAVNTTRFYKDNKGYNSLLDFPVVDKIIIKENYEAFLSDRYNKAELRETSTSGSSGTPFLFHLTKEKWTRRIAEVIYFNELAGFKLGMRHLDIKSDDKSKIVLFLRNTYKIKNRKIDEEWLRNARQLLLHNKAIKIAVSFPSTLEVLANYCLSQNDTPDIFSLESVILKGEPLHDKTCEILKKAFKCKIFSRYAAEEFGVLALNCIEGNQFHLNTASYYFEILSVDCDRPAEPGEKGRLVISDCYSYAVPLIRYDLGDIVEMGEKCICGSSTPTLKKIEGRMLERIYNTKGDHLTPMTISNILQKSFDIMQFQFIQKGKKEYELKLCVMKGYTKNAERNIKEKLLDVLGDDANFKITYPNSIPSSTSGKRHYIINEYKKQYD